MKIEVEEYLEQDCGHPCTENGCPGHTITSVPISVCIDGLVLYTPWYDDMSNWDKEQCDRLNELLEKGC